MKVGLFIFLWSICLVGSLANGKKFVQENETIQLENCEPSDTDESEVTLSFFSDMLPGVSSVRFQPSGKAFHPFALLAVRQMAPDSFFSPPDSAIS